MTREGRRGATNLRYLGWRLLGITAALGLVGAGVVPGCGSQPTDTGGEDVHSAEQAANVCVTIQRGLGASVVEDAYVNSGASGTNYGVSPSLYAGKLGAGTVGSLLRFDLSGLPAGATITKADLTLQEVSNTLSTTVYLHHLTGKWTEGAATWANTVGAGLVVAAPDLTFSNGATGFKGAIKVSIMSVVQSWYAGNYANNGFIIKLQDNSLTNFNSSENNQALRPSLQVCYDQSAACSDGVQDNGESDVDCGGAACPKCATGKNCVAASDCTTGICNGGVCASPGCNDGLKNGTETDTDCGGGACPACADNQHCLVGSDCANKVCNANLNVCKPASCLDNVQNGTETDKDCGGAACAPCVDGKKCVAGSDCTSGNCAAGFCATGTCNDGLKNQGEAGVDCGGPCPAVCPTCNDGIQNQGEAGVDCGGPCAACASCFDGLQNQGEEGIDCGGPCAACVVGGCDGPEVCNGRDDNCDGNTDEGNPGGGQLCNTGIPGACSLGTTACSNGAIVCNANQGPTAETCNGIDDNCNGVVDEGNPGGGAVCNTGGFGACQAGHTACVNGALACVGNVQQGVDICDNIDNDCNGNIDNGLTDGFAHSCGAAATYNIPPGGSGTFNGTTAGGDDYMNIQFTSVPGAGGSFHPIITFTSNPGGNYRMQVLEPGCGSFATCPDAAGNVTTWQMTYPGNPNGCQAPGTCTDSVPKVTNVVVRVSRVAGGNDSCVGYTITASQ